MTSAAQRDIPDGLVYLPPRLPQNPEEGAVFPVDKPKGKTSFDVVKAVRRAVGVKKVGHAGTLDPMATGLLIVLVARPATRLQDAFMHRPKTYTGTLRLGETTPSHDAETDVTERNSTDHLTEEEIAGACKSFVGTINQVPPMYSAVKIEGERLYKKARRGETVDRSPRQVTIHRFEITNRDGADVSFCIECSKGTYIRSLARDVGAALDVGAHLTALRRTAIGSHRVANAWTLSAVLDALAPDARTSPTSSQTS